MSNIVKPSVIAVIDVGSNSIRLSIAQVFPTGESVILDELSKPSHIGKDTFSFGRIQIATIHNICSILKGFAKVMKEYDVKKYLAVCTSGMREAENREYVIEQIRIRTGINVEIINNAQERFYMYKAIRSFIKNFNADPDAGTLIIDIGSGGVEISVFSKGVLKFTDYIKIGSLRLREILADLEKRTLNFPRIMNEFIESRIDFLELSLKKMQIKNFIGLGGELSAISKLCVESNDSSKKFIKKKSLENIYSKIYDMTAEQISTEFNIQKSQAEILLPSVILFRCFLNMTNADGVHTPLLSLRHGLLSYLAEGSSEAVEASSNSDYLNDIISSVWQIGRAYAIDEVHCKYMEKICLSIFDQTSRIHMLGSRERLYLHVAAVLHDIGKYINSSSHDLHSYNIIRFKDIIGFSDTETNIVANIARYHSDEIPSINHENYSALGTRERIVVSKLSAIIRLAEALDISHNQKINKIVINSSENQLMFNAYSMDDILLEEWCFSNHTVFFEEVMGQKPVLIYKGR